MVVTAVRKQLTLEETASLGVVVSAEPYDLEVGRQYVVYGLRILSGRPFVEFESSFGYLYPAPLVLFEVTDSRCSASWRFVTLDEGFALWPEELLLPYFHDRLSDADPEAVWAFNKMKDRLTAEFAD
jgi:hypothetical protein